MADALLDIVKARRGAPPHPAVGDVWHRVDGSQIGDEIYEGMELEWSTWRVVKVTRCGAWLQCVEWGYRKPRFALASGARWCNRTQAGALQQLIARKRRHLVILASETTMAEETLALALAAAKALGSAK